MSLKGEHTKTTTVIPKLIICLETPPRIQHPLGRDVRKGQPLIHCIFFALYSPQ